MEEYPNCDWRKYKMARLNKKRYCKVCKEEIDNSNRKINKRTKFCSLECVNINQERQNERRRNRVNEATIQQDQSNTKR